MRAQERPGPLFGATPIVRGRQYFGETTEGIAIPASRAGCVTLERLCTRPRLSCERLTWGFPLIRCYACMFDVEKRPPAVVRAVDLH